MILILPEVSPEAVVGKMTVRLLISNRLVWGLTGSARGVAAWGGKAERLLSTGAMDTSKARS